MHPFLNTVAAIVWKDLTTERHTGQTIIVMLVFSLSAVITFNFAQGANALGRAGEFAVGFLWATIFLAGTLGLNRSFTVEIEQGALGANLMAPVDRSALYVGKVCSVTITSFIVELVLIPIFVILFGQPMWRPLFLLFVAVGTVGYVAIGVLVTAMAVQTRAQAVLIPVFLLPLTLPLIFSAASGSAELVATRPAAFADVQAALVLVLAYDLLMLAAGYLTYNYVIED